MYLKVLLLCTLTSKLFHAINLFFIHLGLCTQSNVITFQVTTAHWRGEKRKSAFVFDVYFVLYEYVFKSEQATGELKVGDTKEET